MTARRWHVRVCPGGWIVTTPDDVRVFYANSLKIAHAAATIYARQESDQIAAEARAGFRQIIARTWPGGLRDLIESDTRDQIVGMGFDPDEWTVSNAADALQRLVENGGDTDD